MLAPSAPPVPFLRSVAVAIGLALALACRAAPTATPQTTPVTTERDAPDRGDAPRPGVPTLIVLPDTQHYARDYPELLAAQTRWIAEARRSGALDVRFVLHVGDLVDTRTAEEWRAVRDAFADLGDIPYALAPGNHDYERGVARTTQLADYFPVEEQARAPTFGGVFEPGSLDNSYHVVSMAGRDWVILALEFGPRDAVLAWARGVLDAHPGHLAIAITHAYLYTDSRRYDWGRYGEAQRYNPHWYRLGPSGERWPEVNDGQQIWDALLGDRGEPRLVVCGHVPDEGVGRLTSETATGARVHQLLANFQSGPRGGDGYLRIVQLADDAMEVWTYSPALDRYQRSPEHQFSLPRNW